MRVRPPRRSRKCANPRSVSSRALPERQRATATRPFDDRDRVDWHYTPRSRNGISLKELDARGRDAVHALLKTALSAVGLSQGGEHHRAGARAARARGVRPDARSRALPRHVLRHAKPHRALGMALRRPSPVAQLHARGRTAGRGHAELLRRQSGDGAERREERTARARRRARRRMGGARFALRRATPRGGDLHAHLRRHRDLEPGKGRSARSRRAFPPRSSTSGSARSCGRSSSSMRRASSPGWRRRVSPAPGKAGSRACASAGRDRRRVARRTTIACRGRAS